jgi:hypothetical protein
MPTEHVCESYALQPISSTSPVPDDGAMLLAAVTAVLDRTDRVALLERTRAEIHGLTMTELCEAKGWHRPWFYKRTQRAAERVAAYLNGAGQDVDAVQEGKTAPVVSKRGQKSANAEKYGCTATRSLKNNQRKSNNVSRRPLRRLWRQARLAEQGLGSTTGRSRGINAQHFSGTMSLS